MSEPESQGRRKLSTLEQVVCAWPLVLIAVGGAVGGACGGAAWVINTRIMASSMSAPLRYGLVVLTGLAAGGVWFIAVLLLATLFPTVFAPR